MANVNHVLVDVAFY